MKTVSAFLRRHPLVIPSLMLVLSTLIGVMILAARIAISRHLRHLYLPWNLALAWMPLLFALAFRWSANRPWRAPWNRWLPFALWLFFLPNAPYLLTDLVHLPEKSYRHYWADLMLILHFAITGLVLGALSLHIVHSEIERRFGWLRGWCFALAVCGLCGAGVYIGRFLRWNSWDILLQPISLAEDLIRSTGSVVHRPSETILVALFGSLTCLAYLMLASLLRSPLHQIGPPPDSPSMRSADPRSRAG